MDGKGNKERALSHMIIIYAARVPGQHETHFENAVKGTQRNASFYFALLTSRVRLHIIQE